jgi:hypothetical protein
MTDGVRYTGAGASSASELVETLRFCDGVIDSLLGEIERLTSALLPFANLVTEREGESGKPHGDSVVAVQIHTADLRAARAAIHPVAPTSGCAPGAEPGMDRPRQSIRA